jgi:hypothetical protein
MQAPVPKSLILNVNKNYYKNLIANATEAMLGTLHELSSESGVLLLLRSELLA